MPDDMTDAGTTIGYSLDVVIDAAGCRRGRYPAWSAKHIREIVRAFVAYVPAEIRRAVRR